jgi:hypothetical protein
MAVSIRWRPRLVRGYAAHWPGVRRWTVPYLRDLAGHRTVRIEGRRTAGWTAADGRFEPSRWMDVELRDYLDALERGRPGIERFYLAQARVTATLPELLADLGEVRLPVLGERAARLTGAPEELWRPGVRDILLFLGPSGTVTPTHFDEQSAMLVQVAGHKTVHVAPPSARLRRIGPEHTGLPGNLASCDLEELYEEQDRTGGGRRGRFSVERVRLGPGDALHLPFGWWHQVRSEDFSVSLNYSCLPLRDALRLRARAVPRLGRLR